MKPQESHIKVIAAIRGIIDSWEQTNDIKSPTHECEIRPMLYAALDDEFCDDYITRLDDALNEVCYLVQRADKEQITE